MKSIRQLLEDVLAHWPGVKADKFKEHPFAMRFRRNLPIQLSETLGGRYRYLKVVPHIGHNQWAQVPALALLNEDVAKDMKSGLFPVWLFKADGSGVYLSLNQGWDDKHPEQNLNRKALLLAQLPQLSDFGAQEIDLQLNSHANYAFEQNNIAAKYYPATELPDDSVLLADLQQLLSLYQQAIVLLRRKSREKLGEDDVNSLTLPKPFILLAGVSGCGKSRFVRTQAELTGQLSTNYLRVAVRPDWHDPSDLFGYVSRLGKLDAEYVVTDILRFIVDAWKDIIDEIITTEDDTLTWRCRDLDDITPYWLCLDEMNLAPVEQYFADYLSVLETRRWQPFHKRSPDEAPYYSESLIKPQLLAQLGSEACEKLRKDLGLGREYDQLWYYFYKNGIGLPFNLIVAGTVNMDETTHRFSRKVIDRAFTIDFGSFYPNELRHFYNPQYAIKGLDFPTISQPTPNDLDGVLADPNGNKSIEFLARLNDVLQGSQFELGYRALNELLVMLVCFEPVDDFDLQALWDDYLMCKVLPRIEGNVDTFMFSDSGNLLDEIYLCLAEQLYLIWQEPRVEWLIEAVKYTRVRMTDCRVKKKLEWMKARLNRHGFTSYWP